MPTYSIKTKIIVTAAILVVATVLYIFFGNHLGIDGHSFRSLSVRDTNYVIAEMDKCLKGGAPGCYKRASDNFFKKFEFSAILEAFEKNEDKQAIFSRCHEVTHYLGRLEFQKSKSVPISYQNASSACHSGAYHGVIEGYFDYLGIPLDDTEALTEAVRGVCGQPTDYQEVAIYAECIHGIGHAMMFITEGELVSSLSFCDSLTSRSDQVTCYGGVFMENSSSSTNLDHPSKYIKSDDPLYPCNILQEKYLGTCYSYQSSHFALISGHDWSKVDVLCQSVPVKYQFGCFRIIGTNQVGFTQDMAERKDHCQLLSQADHRQYCFDGVVDALVGRYHGDFDRIISFCAILEEENKERCYSQAGQAMVGWVGDALEIQRKCEAIAEEKYSQACLRASGV